MAGSGAVSPCDAITASRAPTTIRAGQEARASVGPMESAGASSPNSDAASARRAAPPSRARAASAGGKAAGSATSAAIACAAIAAQNGSMNAAAPCPGRASANTGFHRQRGDNFHHVLGHYPARSRSPTPAWVALSY